MSVAVEINRIIDAKKAIKKAIEDKGGSVGDSIDTYASAIDKLSVGGGGGAPTIPQIGIYGDLTFVCLTEFEDGSWLSLDKIGNAPAKTFEYNKNDSGWQSYTENTHIPMVVGDYVKFRSSSTISMAKSSSDYRNFKTHGVFKCLGSVMRLFNNVQNFASTQTYACTNLFKNCYITSAPTLQSTKLYTHSYYGMFDGCSLLMKSPELPSTTLGTYCYYYMFRNCTSLVDAPELPATTLQSYCYQSMFYGCTSLVDAPELPATTLADNCYRYMFYGCISLVDAPELPATTIKQYCYQYMFYNCTSLVNAPALPATTLQNYCYQYMFYSCTSLTTAPELPAKTLVSNCYGYMFNACSKLNYIKAMFTSTPATSYTQNWVTGVASSGTFVKNSAATWTTTGANGVPNGWTIVKEAAS